MSTVGWIVLPMLVLAGLFTVARMVIGPTMLDRVVALEVLVAIVATSFGVIVATSGNATLLPVLAVLTLLGFVGAVSVARFSAREIQE